MIEKERFKKDKEFKLNKKRNNKKWNNNKEKEYDKTMKNNNYKWSKGCWKRLKLKRKI